MWLIQPDVLHQLERERQAHSGSEQEISARLGFEQDDRPRYERILSKAGDKAAIAIEGVMTEAPDIIAMLFMGGNTTYQDIIDAAQSADADEEVGEIEFRINSPGGSVSGLFDCVAAVQGLKTPTRSVIHSRGMSGAFILASATGEIVAANPTSSVGSFGVAVDVMTREGVISITNSGSADKRPDVETDSGQAVVQEHLDSLHAIFEEVVAEGRGVPQNQVTERFGSGRVFAAKEAMERGMIDRIESGRNERPSGNGSTEPDETPTSEKVMDLETLKTQHPDVHRAAVEQGVAQERDRVNAHLTMAQSYGGFETAVEAIGAGAELTQSYTAKYMAAGARNQQMEARDAESQEAENAAAAGASSSSESDHQSDEDKHADAVAAALETPEVV